MIERMWWRSNVRGVADARRRRDSLRTHPDETMATSAGQHCIPPPFPFPELWGEVASDAGGAKFQRRWLTSSFSPPATSGHVPRPTRHLHPRPQWGGSHAQAPLAVSQPPHTYYGHAEPAGADGGAVAVPEAAPPGSAEFVTLDLNALSWDDSMIIEDTDDDNNGSITDKRGPTTAGGPQGSGVGNVAAGAQPNTQMQPPPLPTPATLPAATQFPVLLPRDDDVDDDMTGTLPDVRGLEMSEEWAARFRATQQRRAARACPAYGCTWLCLVVPTHLTRCATMCCRQSTAGREEAACSPGSAGGHTALEAVECSDITALSVGVACDGAGAV